MSGFKFTPDAIEALERMVDDVLAGTPNATAGNALGGVRFTAYTDPTGEQPDYWIASFHVYPNADAQDDWFGCGPDVNAALVEAVAKADATRKDACASCGEPVEPGYWCECREGYDDGEPPLSAAERSRQAIADGMELS